MKPSLGNWIKLNRGVLAHAVWVIYGDGEISFACNLRRIGGKLRSFKRGDRRCPKCVKTLHAYGMNV